jgi:polyketide-type polyunsaturated fatty acid synthase PfaA
MNTQEERLQQPVAIIGMNSIFANSPDLKGYWRTLANGIDGITSPPQSYGLLQDLLDKDPKKPDHIYCNRGGFLPIVPFDPTEFGIPPTALEATDTSQLLGLVAAKMALADAGYGPDKAFDRQKTSVILGVTGTQELVISLGSRLGHPLWKKALEDKGLSDLQKESILNDISDSYVPWQENSFPGLLGNVVAGRICNRLDLGGTNCVVDAACASSLSAIYLALMELQSKKSKMVLTGGVDTLNDSFMHMCFSRTGVLSYSGDARPFSAEADGTVLGEGIGILILKRLEDARKDGDRIYAVIRGIGSSSDGKSQSIYAPLADGQVRALREAYRVSGVSPETVDIVEAHGTGTRVGDEVEFSALKEVFGAINPNGNRCAIGSVKSMIGHTKAAAGAAGMIKSALSLYNKVMFPTLKAGTPDPKLKIESSPFYLNHSLRPWFRPKDHPRRSGVSSFGFGGSNFHVVLEEYEQDKKEIAWDGSVEIIAFSGETAASIVDQIKNVQNQFSGKFGTEQIRIHSKRSRDQFKTDHPFRLVMVVEIRIDDTPLIDCFQSAIKIASKGESTYHPAQGIYFANDSCAAGKVAFLFPGQGSQYTHMGRDLICRFPDALKAVEAVGSRLDDPTRFYNTVFPRAAFSGKEEKEQSDALRQTDVAQPAIGAVSMAMLTVLKHFNVRPDVTCGHSYGELPALYASEWINEETLAEWSAERGSLMAAAAKGADGGGMLAVKASESQLEKMIQKIPDIVLANINGPEQVVLSGTVQGIALAKTACKKMGYRTVDLPVAAAFHSPLVASAAAPFSQFIGATSISPSALPVFANVTGSPYPVDPLQAASLLGRQLTSPVQFQRIVENLYETGVRTFVEVGPKTVLTGIVQSIIKSNDITVIPIDRSSGKQSGMLDLAHALGRLASIGAKLDLKRWESDLPAAPPKKMTVPLSGANYRSPQNKKPAPIKERKSRPSRDSGIQKPRTEFTSEPQKTTADNKEMNKTRTTNNSTINPAGHATKVQPANADLNEALSIVQKGLESIQSLQQQTAQAHQTFLETQAQASKTLQQMMNSTRMLMGEASDIPSTNTIKPSFLSQQEKPGKARNASVIDFEPLETKKPLSECIDPAPASPSLPEPIFDSAPVPGESETVSFNGNISKTLLAVVAELTGYPEEMLGMEMDIEADLGIDSIKRVEILSAMEERMPHLPQVTPDMVGTLKTMGQICAFLSAGGQNTKPTASDQVKGNENPQTVQKELVSIVAELTGYPEEMLGMEMDIEADLGIDSIKRVEILSAMEERMPHLPQVTPDMVGTLKTMGQICAFLSAGGKTQNQQPATRSRAMKIPKPFKKSWSPSLPN